MGKTSFDIHQHITDRIIAAIEAGAGKWQMPWHCGTGGRLPVNIASGNNYRGVNVLALWVDAQANGYSSHLWGTFRQWADKGATVRRGQKASYVVFYKEFDIADAEDDENKSTRRLFARATPVFNADQVGTGASINYGGSRACFIPQLDEIRMPDRALFTGSATSSATEAFFAPFFTS